MNMTIVGKPIIPVTRGVRGDSENRRILFQSENIEIDIRICAVNQKWNVIGQVLSNDGRLLPPMPVYVLCDGRPVQSNKTNYIGEFSCWGLETAVYVFEIDLPHGRIVAAFRCGE
jgi:hypothetical protein